MTRDGRQGWRPFLFVPILSTFILTEPLAPGVSESDALDAPD
jgi:hypothetical protein